MVDIYGGYNENKFRQFTRIYPVERSIPHGLKQPKIKITEQTIYGTNSPYGYDLNNMSKVLYEAWGPEESKKAFVHYPAGTFPGQTYAWEDNTHFNAYGGYQLCKCVLQGLIDNNSPLKAYIAEEYGTFDPERPDDINNFLIPLHHSIP